MAMIEPLVWRKQILELIDQRILPNSEVWVQVTTIEECYQAINKMIVRGAPNIGFTAIFGLALWLKNKEDKRTLEEAIDFLKSARPTAVNLAFELDECYKLIKDKDRSTHFTIIEEYGLKQMKDSETKNRRMSERVAEDLLEKYGKRPLRILTHCNTGVLACGGIGTALGVITVLHEQNRIDKVWVDETRPYLQGSRLTSFELLKQNIPHKIVVEGAASYLMSNGLVDAICVGADRVAMNGDTANKIGTSNLGILAQYYKIPFYVVAPLSSFDNKIQSGKEINIELRNEDEILKIGDKQLADESAMALNPSFDITPGSVITGISCEDKLFKFPYEGNIGECFK